MKYRPILLLLLLFMISGLLNLSNAQKISKDFWQVGTADSIKTLLINFGRAADLYSDPQSLMFDAVENRENPVGISLFKKLFVIPLNSSDSSQYRIDRIVNFLDPIYITTVYNMENFCSGNKRCLDSLRESLLDNPKYKRYLTVNGYLEMMKEIYDRKDINTTILPGTRSEIDIQSISISNSRERISNRRYLVKAYVPFTFSGYYIDKDNAPQNVNLTNIKLVFDVSFDAVKTYGKVVYTNFKIDRISDALDLGVGVEPKYIFNFQPFLKGGSQSVNGTMSSNELIQSYQNDGSSVYQFGFLIGRKLKPFRSEYSDINVSTGVALNYYSINSSISNYSETLSQKLEDSPFTPSQYLKKYSLNSATDKIEFTDNLWLLDIPLRLGIEFKIDPNNRLRGYLNSEISYLIPLSSNTKSKGTIDQSGAFVYEYAPGTPVEIQIGGANNPFPDLYGNKDAISKNGSSWSNGGELQVELGLSFKLKGDVRINIGPYFSAGYLMNKYVPKVNLIESGRNIYSPLNAMRKMTFTGFGGSLSVSFDVKKLKGISIKKPEGK